MTELPALPPPRTPASIKLAWLYAAALAVVLAIRFGAGDGSSFTFASNALLLYFFLPLPLVLLVGIFSWRRDLVLVVGAGAGVLLYLWGGLFLPRPAAGSSAQTLTVLSYNLLGYNFDARSAVEVIHDSGADLVALNELNPENARVIERELGTFYPHRLLDPRPGVAGSGILSKFPFERVEPTSLRGLAWIGQPLAIEVQAGRRRVGLVTFHAASRPSDFRERERQARALADFARTRGGPTILAGDLNATDQNLAYSLVTAEARDAWREVGKGFGHTFPGPPTAESGGSRPVLLGVPVPLWLVRIDYVFFSGGIEPIEARLTESGGSDHRGVIATLAVR